MWDAARTSEGTADVDIRTAHSDGINGVVKRARSCSQMLPGRGGLLRMEDWIALWVESDKPTAETHRTIKSLFQAKRAIWGE
jgi:hypothetical protein